MSPADISVVIPTLNEQASVAAAVESAHAAGATQVIVADAGSSDQTVDLATASGVSKIIRSMPGRGIQLNAGAFFADRQYVLFLHADNQLGLECLEQICAAGKPAWGAFRQRINSTRQIFRAIETGNDWRVRARGMAFGDQAVFVRRTLFKEHGGFAEVPLMEDVDFSKRFRRIEKPVLLDGPVTVDARRWEANGPVCQTLLNWTLQLRYACGASPETLRKVYARTK